MTPYTPDKIADVTHGPTDVYRPEPGPVRYAEVTLDGDRVGVVWVAASPSGLPRAGIVNDPRHLSATFQSELGPQCLAFGGTDTPGDELLAFLAESRDGVDGTLNVSSEVSTAPSLHDLYIRLGYGG